MTIYSKAPFKHVTEFTNLTTEELFSTPEFKAAVLAAGGGGGGGLEGTNIYVAANGTDVENAAELQAAYTTAQGMSPSATNRITIIAGPGYYNFGNTTFAMYTSYIDLVSLDGQKSIIFNSSASNNFDGSIFISVDDIFVHGVNVQNKPFGIDSYLYSVVISNCQGGDYSFGAPIGGVMTPLNIASTFINCMGGNRSFGNRGIASGIFVNCEAGGGSFGGNNEVGLGYLAVASGTFKNCISFGDASFGGATYYTNAQASGNFENCIAQGISFGTVGTASGIFTECIANGQNSFGSSGTASGTFTRCRAFSSGGFASSGTFSGVAYYCVATDFAFGRLGTVTGRMYYCKLNGSFAQFGPVSGSGKIRLCIDGYESEVNAG